MNMRHNGGEGHPMKSPGFHRHAPGAPGEAAVL